MDFNSVYPSAHWYSMLACVGVNVTELLSEQLVQCPSLFQTHRQLQPTLPLPSAILQKNVFINLSSDNDGGHDDVAHEINTLNVFSNTRDGGFRRKLKKNNYT